MDTDNGSEAQVDDIAQRESSPAEPGSPIAVDSDDGAPPSTRQTSAVGDDPELSQPHPTSAAHNTRQHGGESTAHNNSSGGANEPEDYGEEEIDPDGDQSHAAAGAAGEDEAEDDDEDDDDDDDEDSDDDDGDQAEEDNGEPEGGDAASAAKPALAAGPASSSANVIEIEQAPEHADSSHPNASASTDPSAAGITAPSDAAAATATSTAVKPKSRAPKQARSPSPAPPPPPPPALTVRLVIELGGPSNYTVNVLELAKETGQRHPTPPPARRDSDSESDDDEEGGHGHGHANGPPIPRLGAGGGSVLEAAMALAEQGIDPGSLKDGDLPGGGGIGMTKPRRRKRRDAMDDYYDVADPFIDDSELGVDAPTHFAQTKQKGFYVNSGDVTLVLDEPEAPVKKPRKRRAFVPETPSFLVGKGKPPHAHEHPSSTGMRTVSAPSVPPVPPLYAKPESHSYPHSQSHPAGRPPLSVSVNANVPRTTGEGTRDSPIALLDGDGDEDSKMEAGDISIISMVSLGGDEQQDAKRVKLANGSARGVSASGSAGSGGMGAPPVKVEMGSPRASTINSLNGSANGNGNGIAEAGRKRKHSSVHEFSPALQASFAHLRTLVASADFTTKSKFPPQLRGPLADAAIQAVELEEYGEAFFRTLPEVFPYNKFTMTKLVKRLIYDRHTEILNKRIDSVLEKLKHAVEEGFPAAERAWRDDVAKWEEKQKRRVKADDESAASNAPTPNPAGDASAGAGKDATPPAQRYKLTDDLRNMIWHLVTINNEMAAMTNQMHEWEAQNHPAVSDQSMRKNLYQRIVGVFPEGWMNTGLISREFSNMKRKVQLADEQGED